MGKTVFLETVLVSVSRCKIKKIAECDFKRNFLILEWKNRLASIFEKNAISIFFF